MDIDSLISQGQLQQAEQALSQAVVDNPDDAQSFFQRGRLRWRMGNRAGAISDYERAAALDPASPAVAALEMSRDIMDYFNPDLLNP